MIPTAVQYTSAGLAELISAKNAGLKGAISHVAAGSSSYTPSATQTSLVSEQQRVPVSDWEELSLTQLRLGAVFDGDKEYEVREVGFYLETGTLLAVYSAPNTLLTYKSTSANWVQKFTLDISPLPTGSLTVVVGTENINPMMTEPMLTSATAFLISQTTQIKTAHQQLLLSEKLRQSGVTL